MKELGLEIIDKLYDNGYVAYIVVGYVRDELLGIMCYILYVSIYVCLKVLTFRRRKNEKS